MNAEALGGLYLLIIIALIVLFVLWVLMPLAVFGIKGLLKQALSELRQTNRLLTEINGERAKGTTTPRRAEPAYPEPSALDHLATTQRFTGSPNLPPT